MTEREHILQQLQQIGDSIVAMFGRNCETCIHDLTDLHHSLIHINGSVTGREIGKQPTTMTTEEKTALVEILERNGALQFKGAVEQIALLAGVSKYTIYNYLEKIHARQAVNHL